MNDDSKVLIEELRRMASPSCQMLTRSALLLDAADHIEELERERAAPAVPAEKPAQVSGLYDFREWLRSEWHGCMEALRDFPLSSDKASLHTAANALEKAIHEADLRLARLPAEQPDARTRLIHEVLEAHAAACRGNLAEMQPPIIPEKPAVPTVVCQIALAIDTEGSWTAFGSSEPAGDWRDFFMQRFTEAGAARHIVEVPIPVPQVPVVRAEAREVRP